eukprot:9335-Heterococcus_DN1.PRE.1
MTVAVAAAAVAVKAQTHCDAQLAAPCRRIKCTYIHTHSAVMLYLQLLFIALQRFSTAARHLSLHNCPAHIRSQQQRYNRTPVHIKSYYCAVKSITLTTFHASYYSFVALRTFMCYYAVAVPTRLQHLTTTSAAAATAA